jgi:acyl-CoA synthetase (AMP-forming)/AMP-acid ligase II
MTSPDTTDIVERDKAQAHVSADKVPSRWVITTHEQIPTLPSGKFNRRAPRALIAAARCLADRRGPTTKRSDK